RYLAARYNNNAPGGPCRVWDWREGGGGVERSRAEAPVLALDFRPDGAALVLGGRRGVGTRGVPSGGGRRRAPRAVAPRWGAARRPGGGGRRGGDGEVAGARAPRRPGGRGLGQPAGRAGRRRLAPGGGAAGGQRPRRQPLRVRPAFGPERKLRLAAGLAGKR